MNASSPFASVCMRSTSTSACACFGRRIVAGRPVRLDAVGELVKRPAQAGVRRHAVLRSVGAVAPLQRGDAVVVARERQRHQLHVQQRDRLDHAVGLEREPALVARRASSCRARSSCTSCPSFPIVTSTSRMLSKCSFSRCLSSALSAELFIRLFSSAAHQVVDALAGGRELRRDGIRRRRAGAGRGREPDQLRVQRVRVLVARSHLPGAGPLERNPIGDVGVLRRRIEATSDRRRSGSPPWRSPCPPTARRSRRRCRSRLARSRSATDRAPPRDRSSSTFCGQLMFLRNVRFGACADRALTALVGHPGEPGRGQRAGRVGKKLFSDDAAGADDDTS